MTVVQPKSETLWAWFIQCDRTKRWTPCWNLRRTKRDLVQTPKPSPEAKPGKVNLSWMS